MIGHIGFSYIGLVFLLLLILPNILFAKRMPREYTSANESEVFTLPRAVGRSADECLSLAVFGFQSKKLFTLDCVAVCRRFVYAFV